MKAEASLEPLTMMIDSSIGGCQVDSRFITIGATDNDWQLNQRLSGGQLFYYHLEPLTNDSSIEGCQVNSRFIITGVTESMKAEASLESLTMMIDSSIEGCRVDIRFIIIGATDNDD